MTCKERSVNMALSPKQPVKRGLWTWHSTPQMIFSSSFGLWSWSTIHPQSIYSLGADIYVNHPQSPPSHFQDYSTCKSARWLNLFPWFDPNEWGIKNDLLNVGLNPGLLGQESTALPLEHEFPWVKQFKHRNLRSSFSDSVEQVEQNAF